MDDERMRRRHAEATYGASIPNPLHARTLRLIAFPVAFAGLILAILALLSPAAALASLETSFTIEKEQRLEGEARYTKSPLRATLGAKVEYAITVTNTGGAEMKFSALNDPKCQDIVPSGEVKIAPGKSRVYTCEHRLLDTGSYTNIASIAVSEFVFLLGALDAEAPIFGASPDIVRPAAAELPAESNAVVVEVPFEPAVAIEKEQKIEGEAGYTAGRLTAKLGQTVDYKITVRNTGDVELNLGALIDAGCENLTPSGPVKLPLAADQLYTCEHKNLAVGTYTNVASIDFTELLSRESNKVEVEVPAQPSFTIEKEQKLEGEAAFTKGKLTAKLGQNVDYKVTVKNTGNIELSFTALSDPHCENIAPSGPAAIPVGASKTYTCEHKNLAVGTYTNVASIGFTELLSKESNKVEVEVPAEPGFTIEKEQRLEGEATYTKSKLTAKLGQNIDYKVIVKNTGNTELALGALADAKCEAIAPSTAIKLAVGASQTYTCEHKGLAVGGYSNNASVSAGAIAEESNTVLVEVPAEPGFTIEKEQRLEGEATYTKSKLTAKLGQNIDYKVIVKNTGNTELALGALADAKCEAIVPGTTVKLAVGASQTYTCEHKGLAVGSYVNSAAVSAGETTKESNKVEVEVPAQPSFTIEKEQAIEGSPSFTSGKLTAKAGQNVDYRVTVRNTGNVELSFGALNDPKCENIAPGGSVKLAPGAAQTYTCEHKGLTVGSYANTAAITDLTEVKEETKESNAVVVEVLPAEPAFTIEKEQKLEGEAAYTESRLTAKAGQNVDYRVTVRNTGNVELTFNALRDSNCENIAPTGAIKLAIGASQVYTCEHRGLVAGTYTNAASIGPGETLKESNKVEVVVPVESAPFLSAFTIEKEQRIEGEAAYTKSRLTATAGQNVDYKITVKNTGATELSLGPLIDANCENLTPSGAVKLAVGATQSYTCDHTDLQAGTYKNTAAIANGNEAPRDSNTIEVAVSEPTGEPRSEVRSECEVARGAYQLHGLEGEHSKPFRIWVSSLGVRQVIFSIDGKQYRRLHDSQAKHGRYTVTINPRRFAYGKHKVSIAIVMSLRVCKPITRAGAFIRPKPARPMFTG